VLCSVAGHFLSDACSALSTALNTRCKLYYSSHIFHATARLDVPTWDDPVVASQINALSSRSSISVSWRAILTFVDMVSTFLTMFSQLAVLFGLLRRQKEGLLCAALKSASELAYYLNYSVAYSFPRSRKAFISRSLHLRAGVDLPYQLGLPPRATMIISGWRV
jgi:hypothetical protein